MANQLGYGFYFEYTGRGSIQGPNDSSGEHFTGMPLSESLVRELIQNAVDARRDGEETVTVEFQLKTVPTFSIPGHSQLLAAAEQAVTDTGKLQGGNAMTQALQSLRKHAVPVLRVGDYGTTGLQGSESLESPLSPLSSLTRSTGVSSTDGSRGGSFGIGSSVGFVASNMRAVSYVTLAVDKPNEVIFSSMCRFASHKDDNGAWRDGSGVYTLLDSDDFHYLRDPQAIGDFARRSEFGTDLYIYDYKEAQQDPYLNEIRRAVVRNFMVAIHRGRLVVRGEGPAGGWTLDASTLSDVIVADEELRTSYLPFYRALTKDKPVRGVLKSLDGSEVKLYVEVDESLPKPLGTQLLRSPLMLVEKIRHQFNVPYAAIFICESEPGNKILREIEPPAHNKWNASGTRSNGRVVREIKSFIREQLRELLPRQSGEQTRIEGLEQFVPLLDLSADEPVAEFVGTAPLKKSPVDRESPVRLGFVDDYSTEPEGRSGDFTVAVGSRGIAEDDGPEEGLRGDPSGGHTETKSDSKRVPTNVREGDGVSIIPRRSVTYRSFQPAGADHTFLVIGAKENVTGDLKLGALSSGGDEAAPLPIRQAWLERNGSRVPLQLRGSTIRSLELSKGEKVRIGLEFELGDRYRIGVLNG